MSKPNLPKVLVISHTPFLSTDSMGSTLASYFIRYDASNVAQFYIKDMLPDIPVCKNYYRTTDREILNKILHPFKKIKVGKRVELSPANEKSAGTSDGKKFNRATGLLIRNLVWKTGLWNTKDFKNWVKEFNPDVILLQPGDFGYIIKLAVKLSKKLHIPLMMHQSESYYLKPYFEKGLIYKIYRKNFARTFKYAQKHTSYCVYLCDELKNDYEKHFNVPGETIYKATQNTPAKPNDSLSFIYGGNLGEKVGRAEPLLELGKAVKELGSHIDVYTGSVGEHLNNLTAENGIELHGAVPYDELKIKEKESGFIVHVENFAPFHKEDKKYAFSTKIADMLASGRCIIIYGPIEEAGIKYIKENNLGLVIESKEELLPKLKEITENKKLRETYIQNALSFYRKNHNPEICAEQFNDCLTRVAENKVLRVFHLNCVYNSGSTGKITNVLHTYLKKKGFYSVYYYGRLQKVKMPDVKKACPEWYSKLNHFISKFTGIQYGGCFFTTNYIIRAIKKEKPDIVHLQCINGFFVNIYKLLDFLKKSGIKTVLTLHADFMFTGGCGSAIDCNKFLTECKDCAVYKKECNCFVDGSRRGFKKMADAFKGFDKNLYITSVSPYLMDRANSSVILKGKNHSCIYNGVDTNIFTKLDANGLRQKHNLKDKKVIFHAAPYFTDEPGYIKGGEYIIELAKELKKRNSNSLIFVAGNYKEGMNLPDNIVLLGRLNNQHELAKYYNLADVTVITSKSETFSMIVAESLCAGTPAVGFMAGGPETIGLKKYSRFVPHGNITALADTVEAVLSHEKPQGIAERAHVAYSEYTAGEITVALYEKIMKEDEENAAE